VADAFMTLLPDYFLNALGPALLARTYWRVFCDDPDSFGFVWVVDGKVVGFMTGTLKREQLLRKVIAQSPFAVATRLAVSALSRPAFLKQAWGLLLTLRHERSRSGPSAELMSLGVLPREIRPVTDPAGRPTSAARVLLAAALAAIRGKGVEAFRLYAGTSNHLACAMYRRLGFAEVHRFRLFGEEKICFVGDVRTAV
jgi:GNAT superfamily N-acetyltransferase